MLYILRHGRTEWNKDRKLQGQTDIPLDEEGRKMAIDAGRKCLDVHFDICFSSPLIRAHETAQLFLEGRDVPIIKDERLREMSFGTYEGEKDVFTKPECPVRNLFLNPAEYYPDGGAESIEQLKERTGIFLEEKVKPLLADGKDVLIVGHGAMNCSIINNLRQADKAHFWDGMTDNCVLVNLTKEIDNLSSWDWPQKELKKLRGC